MIPIRYDLVSKAINYYSGRGFEYVEAPWLVSEEDINITLPFDSVAAKINNGKFLVGSAEQSFINMMRYGKLNKGRYCAAGPCFRYDKIDEFHFPYFFKVELIDFFSNPHGNDKTFSIRERLMSVMSAAAQFMGNYLDIQEIETGKNEYDLMFKNIELGSYGY